MMDKTAKVIILGVAAAILSIYSGYVLTIIWGWFVAPTFSLPELSIPQAIGICLVVNFLNQNQNEQVNDSDDSWAWIVGILTKSLLRSTMSLFFGFIYFQFI